MTGGLIAGLCDGRRVNGIGLSMTYFVGWGSLDGNALYDGFT